MHSPCSIHIRPISEKQCLQCAENDEWIKKQPKGISKFNGSLNRGSDNDDVLPVVVSKLPPHKKISTMTKKDQVLKFLKPDVGTTTAVIACNFNMNPNTIRSILITLRRQGKVKSSRHDGKVWYYAVPIV